MEALPDGGAPGWRRSWMEVLLDGGTPGWRHSWVEALLEDLGLGIVGVELLVEVGELVDHHVHRQVASVVVVVGMLLVDVGLMVAFGRHHIVVVVLQEVL